MNNTTKFFALIENKATLLQSCLLHRYFNVIRIKRLNRLISSGRNGDEFNLGELTTILGMDDEEETKDFLEQLGYSVTASSPVGLLIPATPNQNDQQPINRLSQKLIRSKYQGNLKDVSRETTTFHWSTTRFFLVDYHEWAEYGSDYRGQGCGEQFRYSRVFQWKATGRPKCMR